MTIVIMIMLDQNLSVKHLLLSARMSDLDDTYIFRISDGISIILLQNIFKNIFKNIFTFRENMKIEVFGGKMAVEGRG